MKSYRQLTQEQRYQIYALKKAGHNQTEIANVMGVHKSTICRELRRNRGQRGYRPSSFGTGYRPQQAHGFAIERRQQTGSHIQPQTWELVAVELTR